MSLLNKISPESTPPPDTFVITGVPGVGKTTLAAQLPAPLFIALDPSGLRGHEHLPRFQIQRDFTTFQEVINLIDEAIAAKSLPYQSLVIDTLDALETLIYTEVCQEGKVASIEEYAKGFGKGYIRAKEKLEELLQKLTALNQRKRMIIMFLSHVQSKTVRHPDGMEFLRWQMKGNEKFNASLLGWADNVLFANFELFRKGKDAERIAVLGERKLYTTETAAYQAKNRWGLPESLPLEWTVLRDEIEANRTPALQTRLTALIKSSTLPDEKKAAQLAAVPTLPPDRLRKGIAVMLTLQPK